MEMKSSQNEHRARSEATAQADSWQRAVALFGAARCGGWGFEGSNWENPDAQDFRYWQCLREAIEERWEILYRDRLTTSPGLDAISGYQFVVNNRICRTIGTCLNTLADYFIDPKGRKNWSDFPNTLGKIRPTFYYYDAGGWGFWTDATPERTDCLYNRNGCHYNDLPQAGSPASAYGNFLKSCYNALNLMTIYAPASVPIERCYAGIDYNPYLSGETSQETEHSRNRETMERWLRVVKSGVPETYRAHTYFTDTFVGRVTSGAELSKSATANPGSLKSFTTSVWRSGNYDEYTANPRLRFDFGLSFSPSQFQIQHEFTLIPDTHDGDGDDYDVTISRASRDYDFTPLFYPHRATDGNVILLLRAGTDLRRFGGVTLEEPSTYENSISEGFHVFNLGALSETPTFTLGNEAVFPGFQTVTENHPKHTSGAAFSYYFLINYGREGGFQFSTSSIAEG